MRSFVRRCRSAVILVIALLPLRLQAHGQQTLRVPEDFPTIQLAIDASQTGDTVQVGPGTWFENLTLDTRQITLRSAAGAQSTILDGRHLGPVVRVLNTNGFETRISGFTVQNGSPLATAPGIETVGPAGILLSNSGAHISGSTLQKNAGINLGVINGSLDLEGSQISTAPTSNGVCALTPGASVTNPSTGVYLYGASTVLTAGAPLATPASSTILCNTIFGDGTRCSGAGLETANLASPLTITNNVIRNNSLGLSISNSPLTLLQNLIYDNAAGALNIATPVLTHPNTDPATTLLVNNTVVNNLTAPDPQNSTAADIVLSGTVAAIAFQNNILLGTTAHPVLTCETQSPSANDTPLLLDHNDIVNTSAGPTLRGDCTPTVSSPLSANGNISVDPRLTGSTDLHPQTGSPVLDAGLTSAVSSSSDLDGNPRLADATGLGYPVVDLGAYERPAPASSVLPTAITVAPSFRPFVTQPGLMPLTGDLTIFGQSPPAPVSAGAVTLFRDGTSVGTASLEGSGHFTAQLALTSPGVVALTATYSGALGLAPSASPVIYVLVTDPPAPATTTLSLDASPSAPVYTSRAITLTAHLGSTVASGGSSAPGPTPPGDLSLFDNDIFSTNLQPDAQGLVTYVIPHPSAGAHIYTVRYFGATPYGRATASTPPLVVAAPAITAILAGSTPHPAAFRQSVTITATVTSTTASGTPSGSITFADGATPLGGGPIPLTAGTASVSSSTLAIGLHTITITYLADPAFSSSTATTVVNVGGVPTTTTLISGKDPASRTDLVTYAVTVSHPSPVGRTPGGSVQLTDGSTLLATAALSATTSDSSTAALVATLSQPGDHTLTATYLPATAADAASSGTLVETITPPPSATVSLTGPASATTKDVILLSAEISPISSLASTVTFYDGSHILGAVGVITSSASSHAALLLQPGTLSPGDHSLIAVASAGDGTALGTSNVLLEHVGGSLSTLTLSASPSPTALATAAVTLSANLIVALPNGVAPSGTITFLDGALPLGSVGIAPDGHAGLVTASLSPGTHTLSASFSGNASLAPVVSEPAIEVIDPNPTATQLIAPSISVAFAPITLSAHVSSSTSTSRLFTPSCTPICTPVSVSFTADTPGGRLPLGTAALNASGDATLSVTPAAGTYSLLATFNGSPIFAGSTSPAGSLVVAPATSTLSFTANPNPVSQFGIVTLTAALVSPGLPATAFTGSITILEGSTTLGSPIPATGGTFAYLPSATGPHTLTAVFAGSANLSGSSATLTVNVLPSDFTLSLKDPTLTIKAEHHAPTTVQISTTGALADTVELSCSNLPQYAHCTFSPGTLALAGGSNNASATLTLDTDALLNFAGALFPVQPLRPSNPHAASPANTWAGNAICHAVAEWCTPNASSGASRAPAGRTAARNTPAGQNTLAAALALCLPTALLASSLGRRRRRADLPRSGRLPNLLAVLLLSIGAGSLSGCSGLYPPHVAPGTYTITVTGHAQGRAVDRSTTLTLIVTP